jgi:zinc protease
VKQTKAWVEKYFGEIKRGEAILKWKKQPVQLTETKNCIGIMPKLPQLTLLGLRFTNTIQTVMR